MLSIGRCPSRWRQWIGINTATVYVRRTITSVRSAGAVVPAILSASTTDPLYSCHYHGKSTQTIGGRCLGSAFHIRRICIPSVDYERSHHNLIVTPQHPQQLSQSRWNSSSSKGRWMPECKTLGEALDSTSNNLEILSPRNAAAFWAVVPQLLQRENVQRRGGEKQPEMKRRFDTILTKTMEDIET